MLEPGFREPLRVGSKRIAKARFRRLIVETRPSVQAPYGHSFQQSQHTQSLGSFRGGTDIYGYLSANAGELGVWILSAR